MLPAQESLTDTLRQMATGFARTQELYTTVKLGIADHLVNGPRQSHELAQAVDAQPDALHRFLRKLVVLNLLAQEDDGAFRLLPLGELLCTDHPDSLRNLIIYICEVNYRAQQGLLYSVKTGKPAFDHVFGMSFFDFFAQRPDIGALFNDLMSRGVNDRVAGVVAAYDFSQADTIAISPCSSVTFLTQCPLSPRVFRTILSTSMNLILLSYRIVTNRNDWV